jgi:putative chitinase
MAMKVGSKGLEVRLLQERLKLTIDGDFGTGTEKVVKEWQQQNGLTPDGIVGFNTWEKMFNVSFDLNKLDGVIPDTVIFQIPMIMTRYSINTPLRLAHFLAQCKHESGNFSVVYENLNYSGDGLRRVFPKYFPAGSETQYARQPEKIANKVYENRMGNGPSSTGEGYKFRGRGYIQLTGKENYKLFSDSIGENCVENPDLVATKYPLASAAWFFSRAGLNATADRGFSDAIVAAVSKRVNGGTIGLSERLKDFKTIWAKIK